MILPRFQSEVSQVSPVSDRESSQAVQKFTDPRISNPFLPVLLPPFLFTSAGGALALALASHFGPSKINSVTAFFPMIDFANDYSLDMAEIKHSEVVDPSITKTMKDCYVVKGTDLKDPRLTLKYSDPTTFPHRVTVLCANGDT